MTTEGTAPGELMRQEIAEQPDRWLDLVADRRAVDGAGRYMAELGAAGRLTGLVLAARGSSDHAAIYAQYLSQSLLAVPAAMATPSVATVYGRDVHDPNSCLVAVSQSGASPDLVATLESARSRGAPRIAFTNDPGSLLARSADVHVLLAAWPGALGGGDKDVHGRAARPAPAAARGGGGIPPPRWTTRSVCWQGSGER